MITSLIKDIFINITILVSFLFIAGQVFNRKLIEKDSSMKVRAIIGLSFGFMGMVLMIFTINVTDLVLADLRNIAVICGGIFGGPVGVILSSTLIALFRVVYFGVSTASVTSAITSIIIGIVLAYVISKTKSIKKKYIYMFLISLTSTIILLFCLLKTSPNLIRILEYYVIINVLGAGIAYYACEYILFSNKTFKEMSYYQIMADNLLDMITIHKNDGLYKYASPSSTQLLGKAPREMIGKSFFKQIHPEDVSDIIKIQDDLENNVFQEYTKELRLKNDKGEFIWVESTFKSIKDSEGKNKEIICATRNVTERKKIDEDLKTQTTEAIEANRLKSQFLANMSHELRTPLNSIIGFTTRVIKKTEGILPEMHQENLIIVKDEAQHLLSLINDLLDYSKIEAGKMVASIESFDLGQIIDEAVSMTQSIREDKNLKFEKRIADDIDLEIKSDCIKSKQILINLLSNAFKYSDEGTVELIVDRTDTLFKIEVKDQGIGISEEDLNNIFEEFHQVDGSYTRKVGGTGLGLAITKRFVEMIGGEIEVKSEIGTGSSFTVYLPIDYNISNDIKQIAVNDVLKEKSVNIEKEKVIAFIEDDFSTRRLYSQYLKEEGFYPVSIDEEQSLEKMIQRVIELKPQAIILDIILKNKDGWEVLNSLKQNPETKYIPVIMSSVLNEEKIAYKLYADEYLVKPVMQEELISAINRIVKDEKDIEVLVVDDDENYLKLLGQYLDETQISYMTAIDGEQAITMIERHNPNLVILDLMMPGVNGFEVLDWIRKSEKHSDISAIVVSAKDLTEKEKNELLNNANMIIHKSGMQIEEVMKEVLKDKGWNENV